MTNKKVDFILCLFLGYLGIHKFYEKKTSIGILYLFTLGIFCIGWIYDCIKLGIEICKIKTNTSNNYTPEIPYKNEKEVNPVIQNTLKDINVIESNDNDKIDNPINITATNVKISKRDKLAHTMNPSPIWNDGTDAQQEFASNLVDEFCNRFAKYLCWGIKDYIIESNDADAISDALFMSINTIDDAKWWCNRKTTNDFTIASKLLEDDEIHLNIIKKLKKEYN